MGDGAALHGGQQPAGRHQRRRGQDSAAGDIIIIITVPSLVLVTVKTPHHPQAGLMSPDENQGNAPVITRSGFQFLLMERSSQVQTTHY